MKHTGLLIAMMVAGGFATAQAQTVIEHGAEHRLQLDFHVPDAALAKFLPADWKPNIATSGPAKDANIRVIFIDRVAVTDAAGKIVGKGASRLVYLAVPVNGPAGAAGQMIIGGLVSDAADAPGPFSNYLAATASSVQRSVAADGEKITRDETWRFSAAGGETFELHAKFAAAASPKGAPSETKFYDPANPASYQAFRVEQVLDIARNATINVDRVSEFSFKGGGGKFAALFDGTEKVLSVDSIPWYGRTISKP